MKKKKEEEEGLKEDMGKEEMVKEEGEGGNAIQLSIFEKTSHLIPCVLDLACWTSRVGPRVLDLAYYTSRALPCFRHSLMKSLNYFCLFLFM